MSSFFDESSLVFIPSGYKTSKAYSVKPTDGTGDLAFTRSNDTATRVASSGLIEKVRTNVALYSEQLDNAVYTKSQASVTANATTAPNGTTTADKLVEDTSNDIHRILQDSLPYTSGTEMTLSVYAKPSGRNKIELRMFDFSSNFASVYFDISTGTILSTIAGVGTITDAGNGWYRCSVTAPASATSANGLGLVYLLNAGGADSYTGDGTSGAFLWGFQVERGVATPYIATTTAAVSVGPVANVPRLDYLGSSCPRLLLEPQRTNLALQSDSVTTSTTNVGYTATSNATTSPDGYASADQILEDTSTLHLVQKEFSVGSTTDTYAASFFVKANGRTNGGIIYGLNAAPYSSVSATFNLTAGTITAASGDGGATAGTSKIENYGNGWYRVSVSGVIGTAGTHYVRLQDTNGGVAGDPTKGFFVWGFQAELGAYATSYIPTLGASVTRGADACYKTGISSLIGQTEGTIFLEIERKDGGDGEPVWLSDGTYDNYIYVVTGNTNTRFIGVTGGAQWNITTGALSKGVHKIAGAYKQNDIVLYVDGVNVGTDTSANIPTCSLLGLGYENGTVYNNADPYNQVLLFKTRLTNSELASLTA